MPRYAPRSAHHVLAVALLAGATLSAGAQDKKKPVEFTADASFLNTSGNTDITAFNLGEKLFHSATQVRCFLLKSIVA